MNEPKSYEQLENEIRIEIYRLADYFHKEFSSLTEQQRTDILHRAESCRTADRFTTRAAAEIIRYAATKQ